MTEGFDQLQPGDRVGEYEVVRKLGEGGMGEVYEAVHPTIGKRAAVKCLHPDLASSTATVQRFIDEAGVVNRIGNRHIVDIFSFGKLSDGRHFYVMELLEGRTLRDSIQDQGRPHFDEILDVVRQVCTALTAAHEASVVHRDLKPENIFLGNEEEDGGPFVQLLDFGIAKLAGQRVTGPKLTTTGAILGTPYYMAPEQCDGRSDVDARADLYALGVIVFEMLTGRPPFAGDSAVHIMMGHLDREPPPPSTLLGPGVVPRSIDDFLLRALAKEPGARPQTAADFFRELRSAGSDLSPGRTASGVPGAQTPRSAPTPSRPLRDNVGTAPTLDSERAQLRTRQPEKGLLQTAGGPAPVTRTAPGVAESASRLPWIIATFSLVITTGAVTAYVVGGADDEDRAAAMDTKIGRTSTDTHLETIAATATATATEPATAAVAYEGSGTVATTDPGTATVRVTSKPTGARVRGLPDGPDFGSTPVDVPAPEADSVLRVRLSRRGFRERSVDIEPGLAALHVELEKKTAGRKPRPPPPPRTAAPPDEHRARTGKKALRPPDWTKD